MNDELKAYVNAYMDGLEVEYRFNTHWYSVESFSDFDDTNADYRIKPKAEDKWQRAIDEQPWKQLIKHVERLDDTVTRLTLEVAKLKEEPPLNFWQKKGRIEALLEKMRLHDKVCSSFNQINKEK